MTLSRAQYESFLVKNVSTISTLESSLRSISWFLPGRFKDAELASEALATLLNVVSMYHDTLLERIVKDNPRYRPLIPTTLHTRFTRAWMDRTSIYKWASRTLELIKFTELMIEMGLRRKLSEKAKWRGIILLEVIKAALRILLLKTTKRPLASPTIPERDFDPTTLPPPSSATSSPTLAPTSNVPSRLGTPDHLRNNHIPFEPHPLLLPSSSHPETSAEEYLAAKALTTASVKPSFSLLRKLSGPRDYLAEIIYILRPLVYVCLLVKDKKSRLPTNRALVVVLIMEFISRNLRRSPSSSALLEKEEYAKRDKDMLWYLLRGSIWETFTRPKLEGFIARTVQKPLVGLFGSLAQDWIPLIDQYYYYTAL
ncbi:hypothetical protein MD484_g7007, partial [Candolleomyces efflorescens]